MAALDAWLCFEDEAGFSMTPPTTRTWARRGRTPVIRVRGRSQRRFSIAALACYRHGERSRLIYRPKRHLDHKRGGRRSLTWTDYRDLLIAAHQQLGAPLVLVWDNLNVHKDRRLREFIDTHDWITCYFLPAYAPDLNPVEGIWSLLRRSSQVNTAFTDPDHLISTLRHGLRQIQYRSNLINGCLAETGLTLTTSRRQRQVAAHPDQRPSDPNETAAPSAIVVRAEEPCAPCRTLRSCPRRELRRLSSDGACALIVMGTFRR